MHLHIEIQSPILLDVAEQVERARFVDPYDQPPRRIVMEFREGVVGCDLRSVR